MMTKTHMAAGVLTAIYLLTATNLPAIPIMLGTIGSIAPDFDFAFGHRKITHSLLGVCIAFILTWSMSHIFAVSFSLNCFRILSICDFIYLSPLYVAIQTDII